MSVFLLILGILLFIGLVILHEFGHFLVARRNGVEVEEFGIGFPPQAWKRRMRAGFIFSLNWLPIGGFVKLKGENDSATARGSFGAANFSTKTKIMLAGVGMNLLAAFVIFMALGWFGMPQLIPHQFSIQGDTKVVQRQVLVGFVEPGSPADKAGLKTRDRLMQIGQAGAMVNVNSAVELPNVTKRLAGQEVKLVYERQSHQYTASARILSGDEAKVKGYLGVAPAEFTMTRSTWSAPLQSLGLMWQFTVETFRGLGTAMSALFHGNGSKASQQVSGPVGIVVVLRDGSLLGIQYVLLIVGLISLSLAIMNVLPIPALDGGRFYVLLLSRIFGRKLSKDMEERIVGASFVFLIMLIIIITVVDVKRYF